MFALAIDFTQPFEDAFSKLLSFIPNLLGGLVILVVGYFVAKVLGKLVGKLLGRVGFDQWMERAGVSGVLQRSGTGLTASAMLGKVVFWFVFLISFTMFASALGVPEISNFMSDMLGYIPRIFAAIVIICLAALSRTSWPRSSAVPPATRRWPRSGSTRSWCTPPSPR